MTAMQPTPADELRAAAESLRSGTIPARDDLYPLLASLLEKHAAFASLFDQLYRGNRGTRPAEGEHTAEVRDALALARAINRSEPS